MVYDKLGMQLADIEFFPRIRHTRPNGDKAILRYREVHPNKWHILTLLLLLLPFCCLGCRKVFNGRALSILDEDLKYKKLPCD